MFGFWFKKGGDQKKNTIKILSIAHECVRAKNSECAQPRHKHFPVATHGIAAKNSTAAYKAFPPQPVIFKDISVKVGHHVLPTRTICLYIMYFLIHGDLVFVKPIQAEKSVFSIWRNQKLDKSTSIVTRLYRQIVHARV